MNKIQTTLVSLVAVVPAGIFAFLLAMSIVNYGGNMGTAIWIANALALLCTAAIIATPFVLLYQHIKERKAERAAEEEAARAEMGEEEESGNAAAAPPPVEEESKSDLLGEDFFDDGDLGTSGVLVSETMAGDDFEAQMGQDDFDSDDPFAEDSGIIVSESTSELLVGESDDAETADALEAYTGPGIDDDIQVEETGEIEVTESSTTIAATDDFDLDDFMDDDDEPVAVVDDDDADDDDEMGSADAVAVTDDFDISDMGLDSESTLSGLHDSVAESSVSDNDVVEMGEDEDIMAATSDFDLDDLVLDDEVVIEEEDEVVAEVAEDESGEIDFDLDEADDTAVALGASDIDLDDEIDSGDELNLDEDDDLVLDLEEEVVIEEASPISDAAIAMDDEFDDEEEDLFIEGYDNADEEAELDNSVLASTSAFDLDADEEDIAGDFLSEMDEDEEPVVLSESSDAIAFEESDADIVIEDSAVISLDDDDEDDEEIVIVEDSADDLDWGDDDQDTGTEIPAYDPEKAEDSSSLETIAEIDLDESENDLEKTETIIALDDEQGDMIADDDEESAAQNFLNALEDDDDVAVTDTAGSADELNLEEDDEIDFSFFDDDDEEDDQKS